MTHFPRWRSWRLDVVMIKARMSREHERIGIQFLLLIRPVAETQFCTLHAYSTIQVYSRRWNSRHSSSLCFLTGSYTCNWNENLFRTHSIPSSSPGWHLLSPHSDGHIWIVRAFDDHILFSSYILNNKYILFFIFWYCGKCSSAVMVNKDERDDSVDRLLWIARRCMITTRCFLFLLDNKDNQSNQRCSPTPATVRSRDYLFFNLKKPALKQA